MQTKNKDSTPLTVLDGAVLPTQFERERFEIYENTEETSSDDDEDYRFLNAADERFGLCDETSSNAEDDDRLIVVIVNFIFGCLIFYPSKILYEAIIK